MKKIIEMYMKMVNWIKLPEMRIRMRKRGMWKNKSQFVEESVFLKNKIKTK